MDDADQFDWSRAVARNRTARRDAVATAREKLLKLPPGQSFTVPLPASQPARRDTYVAVNNAAFVVAGRGNYRIAQAADGVTVTLIKRREVADV